MIKVLVVDDEEPFRRLLKRELGRKGFTVEVAADGREALGLLREQSFDVALLDIVMPGTDGLETMKRMREDPAAPAIIVLTGRATVETAVEAMKNGSFDYLTKPYKLDELVVLVNRAQEYRSLRAKNQLLEQELVRQETAAEIVGESRPLRELLALVRKVAPTDSPVLIQGESGTGKELIANALWHHSRRSRAPLIPLNCATLSESLIESELFGHEKGAFTSAATAKHGLVEVADRGTLFLDEIGELPLALQPKLLRFLDTGEFRRVGGTKVQTADVRVIAATNRDLRGLIAGGRFREDLWYRLNVIAVTIPPLRERAEDVPRLARHFAAKYARKLGKPVCDFGEDALATLAGYSWPGNVRELENVVERAAILCEGGAIGRDDLAVPPPAAAARPGGGSLEEIEREHILRVLREAGGNQSRASQLLGIDRKTLYLKLRRYGLPETP
ncbi:MAG TPA: sigma-54 dependent transcriptional regulator [Anaeromyxobacter sp.]